MKKYPNLSIAVIVLLLLSVAVFQGRQVHHTRTAQAFYHWILSAATNERLLDNWNPDYNDQELYAQVISSVESANADGRINLPNIEQSELVFEGRELSRIGILASDAENNDIIWRVAKSAMLQDVREDFVQNVRERNLLFAQNLVYADALAGEVNLMNLFLGFRQVAANFIWLQVDRYWHQGMVHRMIPLMRTCVTLDPQFVDAYLVGAWHLAYNITAKMMDTPEHLKEWDPQYAACVGEKEQYYYIGADFLKDGIRNNPRNYKLYFDLGYTIYSNKLSDYANAVRYLSEAVRQPHDVWVPRQLNIALERNGQYAEARAGWIEYQRRFPEQTTAQEVAPRFIQRNTGMIYEQRAEEALKLAQEATDPSVAEEHRKTAEENFQLSREIWDEIDDPFALGRKLRMDALNLVEQNRPLEAIAMLDHARWESADFFEEASEMIIRIKQDHDIPRSLSEQKWELRQMDGDDCMGKPPNNTATS